MDPISAGLLVAAATGAGGEAGRHLWATLVQLVRGRPEAGEAELTSLGEAPQDARRAQALSAALSRHAEQDPVFRAQLTQWQQQARGLRTGDGETSNSISGGTQEGPVLQGRDFSGITFQGPGRS
ncbi:hypothetical protein [Streptomyces griseoruber]|uniref:Uncharacterized protein n=1 Tax=Streptomyces griseoruber TaxID=1943 RepID=A0A101SQA5_9ACTN|nr:hypothetical protein [Streptomyces griseoruber]KUN78008.1 hypothetical protein AQJ64_32955 [Streptomyces griseoruber]